MFSIVIFMLAIYLVGVLITYLISKLELEKGETISKKELFLWPLNVIKLLFK